MKFPSGEHGRGEDGDHLGATIPASTRYTQTTYGGYRRLAIQIKTERLIAEILPLP